VLGIEALDADFVFLQEVRRMNRAAARHFPDTRFGWPKVPQADYLAPDGYEVAYVTNAVTRDGEHGNALLSRWPIGDIGHHDVSDHRFEQRGLLHVPVTWNGTLVHAIVAHFGLIHSSRVRQVQRLAAFIAREVPDDEAVIVAGDFNDWGDKLDLPMTDCDLVRAIVPGDPPTRYNTFPSRLPLFSMDRIYMRGFRCRQRACRAARRGRACRTTCRWSPSSSSSSADPGERDVSHRTRRPGGAAPLQPGHQIELLTSGSALFAALVEAIDAARAEVLVETYIFDFAGSVLAVAEALERAAARGVCVRVVVDGIGTDDVPAPWQERWKAAGLFWRVFNPARGWRCPPAQALAPDAPQARVHRRQVAFCGGINLIDDYRDPTYGTLEQPALRFRRPRQRAARSPTSTRR
jgi:endonuclease/exonuclease/phosphatase family metal-dependent hydrolase